MKGIGICEGGSLRRNAIKALKGLREEGEETKKQNLMRTL